MGIWIVLLLLLSLQSLSSQPQDLRAIEEAARGNDWKRVEQLSNTYLKRHPNDRPILYILPLAQMRLGRFDRALLSAQHLRAIDSLRIQPWLMISECEIALNRTSDAVSTLERARVLFPDSVQVTWALGMAYARNSRYEQAIEHLEEAMYRRPDVPGITEQLARCYHAAGRFSESAELFQAVTDRTPNNADAWLKYGESLLALRKLDSARRTFEMVLTLQPDSANAYLALTAVLSELERQEEALGIARLLTQRRPRDPQGWYNYGLLSLAAKQADTAIRCFRTAISIQPTYPEAYFNLAFAYEDQGFFEDASMALKRCALSSSTMAPDAYNSLAIIYRREGRFDEAIATHAQAIALRDTSTIFHAARINTYFEASRCEQGSPIIQRTRARFPDNVGVLYACARCYVRTGKRDDAAEIEAVLAVKAPDMAEQIRLMMK